MAFSSVQFLFILLPLSLAVYWLLPKALRNGALGAFSLLFFAWAGLKGAAVLLALAALTSTISQHEIGTAMFFEQMHISRRKGALIETVLAIAIGILCSLSCGAVDLEIAGMSVPTFRQYANMHFLGIPFPDTLFKAKEK